MQISGPRTHRLSGKRRLLLRTCERMRSGRSMAVGGHVRYLNLFFFFPLHDSHCAANTSARKKTKFSLITNSTVTPSPILTQASHPLSLTTHWLKRVDDLSRFHVQLLLYPSSVMRRVRCSECACRSKNSRYFSRVERHDDWSSSLAQRKKMYYRISERLAFVDEGIRQNSVRPFHASSSSTAHANTGCRVFVIQTAHVIRGTVL